MKIFRFILLCICLTILFVTISSKSKSKTHVDPNFEKMKSNVLVSQNSAEDLVNAINEAVIKNDNDNENCGILKKYLDKFKSDILKGVDDENSTSNLCCNCIKNFNSYLSKMKNFEKSNKVDNYLIDLDISNLEHLPTYKALYSILIIKKLKFWRD